MLQLNLPSSTGFGVIAGAAAEIIQQHTPTVKPTMPPPVIQSVEVLFTEPAVPIAPTAFPVFLKRNGQSCRENVTASLATRVESIIISTIEDTRPQLPHHSMNIGRLTDYKQVPRRLTCDLLNSLRPAATADSLLLDFRSKESNNVAHLLIDIVPYYNYIEKKLPGKAVLVLRSVREPFASILNHLGVRWFATRGAIRGRFVRLYGSRALSAYELKDIFDCWGLQFFPNAYASPLVDTTGLPRRIFLARRDQRALLNHAAVEAELGKRDYTTVFMEDYSIPEQMALGMAAEHVVAVHGAAMSYLALARRLKSVVELSPPHVFTQLFPSILGPMAESYAATVQDFDERVAHSGWSAISAFKDAPFAVDLGLLSNALAEVRA